MRIAMYGSKHPHCGAVAQALQDCAEIEFVGGKCLRSRSYMNRRRFWQDCPHCAVSSLRGVVTPTSISCQSFHCCSAKAKHAVDSLLSVQISCDSVEAWQHRSADRRLYCCLS